MSPGQQTLPAREAFPSKANAQEGKKEQQQQQQQQQKQQQTERRDKREGPLRPSGFDMQAAPDATKTDPTQVVAVDRQGQTAVKKGKLVLSNTKGHKAERNSGSGTSEAFAKFQAEKKAQEARALQKLQDEAMAREILRQEQEAERIARQAAIDEANAGPLEKLIKLQAKTFWGQVAHNTFETEKATSASAVDPKVAGDIAKALEQLGEKTGVDAIAGGEELAQLIKLAGIKCFVGCNVVTKIREMLDARQSAEGALYAIKGCCELLGGRVEPFMVPFLPMVLHLVADKKSLAVRTAASETAPAIIDIVVPHATRNVQDLLFAGIAEDNWHTKLLSLRLLGQFADRSQVPFSRTLNKVVPAVSAAMWDTRHEVKKGATDATLKALNTCQNRDIRPFIPAVIEAIKDPNEVPETLHKLSSTVFVQSVDNPALSITVPILLRGCQEKKIESKRRVCVIADNMCKLVDYAHEATTFMPDLKPAIERLAEEMSDPEARTVAARCIKTLNRIEEVASEFEAAKTMEPEQLISMLSDALRTVVPGFNLEQPALMVVMEYIAKTISGMICGLFFDERDWTLQAVCPYLAPFISLDHAKSICKLVYTQCYKQCVPKETQEDEHDDGEDLCNCEFSLGYGAKILLNNTRLHLKRGKRYGVCGYNGCGKTTLMRAIANGQVENFPPPDVLKTVYVEHDIQGDLSDLNIVDYVCAICSDIPREQVRAKLLEFGFVEDETAPACINACISGLSGGWKMKLALCRAILQNADILLLDEPTNHLDVTNVAWLENFLLTQTDKTSMIISHDSGFLDRVTTNIIHYEDNRKLKNYKGNLAMFVKRVPRAKSYYELSEENLSFTFPEPGLLDGVKSKGKAILKMEKCTYQYPGRDVPTVFDITLQASLNSRVAVIGPNGAGKSTMIKMFCGETKPSKGLVWRHQNMRVAYVAQHAFHHLEKHLDETPNEYIQWRYSSGEDRELSEQEGKKVTAEEEQALQKEHTIRNEDGTVEKKVVEALRSRRKTKRSYEYEVKWLGRGEEHNTYLTREKLEEMGWGKMVMRMDQQEALRAGLATRPLTTKFVEKQLGDMGLEAEFATHSRIRGLSGGQKVKVVIAGCMWNNPHILVMDEPTNYLDRDSLGALAGAIRKYGGGVVLISHNREFTDDLCPERWVVEGGRMRREGDVAEDEKIEVDTSKVPDTVMDSLGNEIKVDKYKNLTAREKKKLEKKRAERRAKGLASDSSDSD
jgi:elongation factor 3